MSNNYAPIRSQNCIVFAPMEYQLAKFNIEICIFVLVSDFKFLQSIDINYVKSDFDNSVD